MENKSNSYNDAIGRAIRHRRTVARLSLDALGRACGITYQQVQKYETGANRVCASRLVQIAEALGCSVADLLPGDTATEIRDRDLDVDRLALRLMSFEPGRRRSMVAALSHALDAIDEAIDPMQPAAGARHHFEGRA